MARLTDEQYKEIELLKVFRALSRDKNRQKELTKRIETIERGL